MPFIHAKRRRPMLVKSTGVATTSAVSAPQQPSVIRSWRMPARMRPIVFVQGRANNAPPTAVIMTPVVAKRPFGPLPRATRVYARHTLMESDSTTVWPPHLNTIRPLVAFRYPLPSSRVAIKAVASRTWMNIPPPTRPVVARQPAPRAAVRQTIVRWTKPLYPPVRNWKQATTIVPRFVPTRRITVAFVHTPYEHAPNVPVPMDPLFVRIPVRVKGVPPRQYRTSLPVYYRPRPNVIVAPQNPPRRRRPYTSIILGTSPTGGKDRPFRPIVLPPRKQKPGLPAILAKSTNVWKPRLVLPVVTQRFPVRLAAQQSVNPRKTGLPTPKIIHPPFVLPRLARAIQRPNTITMATREPTGDTPGPTPDPLWDIIAASINYLRLLPSIVDCFGDVKGTIDKFTSDAEPPGIDPPYAVFYEPEEVESFETIDNEQVITSLVDGIYRVEVFTTEKLTTRKLSEAIANRLNDAPLTFVNGELIYLRRSVRKYPTLEVPGTGTNITMFKRMVEFVYQFERSYTVDTGDCDG